MSYDARILLDSISDAGIRLTTMQVTFPRFVLSEFNTHRVFSRNSASSRAIPTSKMLQRVLEDPVFPVEWGRNQQGMSAAECLSEEEGASAKGIWLDAMTNAIESVKLMQGVHVHKQVINRLLEPFMWHTVIVTATQWENFFKLRCAPSAQPEIRVAAELMRAIYQDARPAPVETGEWHLPLLQSDEQHLDIETRKRVSAARCARVSYLTHDGKRDIGKDVELCDRLLSDRHLSPFEHVATPTSDLDFHANFRGWTQMRKEIESL